MTPIRFKLTEDLVVKAAKLNGSRPYLAFLVFAVVVALLTSAYFLSGRQDFTLERVLMQIGLTMAGALIITSVLIVCLHYVLYPLQARRNFRQQKALLEDMNLSWTDEEYCYEAGKSRAEMPFSNLHGYRASDEILLLYLADTIYHAIPVRAFGRLEPRDAFIARLQKAGVRRR